MRFSLLLLIILVSQLNAAEKPQGRASLEPLANLLITPVQSIPATVISQNHATISAEIAARIEAINVHIGDSVKAGQQLARLDCTTLLLKADLAEAELEAAKATHDLLEKQLMRTRKLKFSKSAGQTELDKAVTQRNESSAQIKALQAQIALAQEQVNNCTIKAPYDGVVTERLAQLGGLATPGTPLVKLLQTAALEVSADLPAQLLGDLKEGAQLQFVSKATANVHAVNIRRIVQHIDAQSQVLEVRFQFKNPHQLISGATGRIEWESKIPKISAEYLVSRKGKLGILIAKGNVAHFHALEDALYGQAATVDLPKDSLVITDGRFLLNDGDTFLLNK